LKQVDLPPVRPLEPYEKATGWVAVGMMRRFTGGIGLPNDGFQWLMRTSPVTRSHELRGLGIEEDVIELELLRAQTVEAFIQGRPNVHLRRQHVSKSDRKNDIPGLEIG
jgi:hypothetical protein